MAASGKTNNLKLPIYVEGNETTSWADYNESMQKIDIFAGENSGKTNTNTDAIQTINDQLQTIVTEQNNNNETTQRLDGRVQSIDRNINTINGTLSSHNQRITTLETEGGEIGSLITTVSEHDHEIGTLKTNFATQNTQVQKNKTDIGAINNEIQEISGDVASAEADIATANNNITQLSNRITAVEGNNDRIFNAKSISNNFMIFGTIYHSSGTVDNVSGKVSIIMNGAYIGSSSNYNSNTPIKIGFAEPYTDSPLTHSAQYIGGSIVFRNGSSNIETASFSRIVPQSNGTMLWLYPTANISITSGQFTLAIWTNNV